MCYWNNKLDWLILNILQHALTRFGEYSDNILQAECPSFLNEQCQYTADAVSDCVCMCVCVCTVFVTVVAVVSVNRHSVITNMILQQAHLSLYN